MPVLVAVDVHRVPRLLDLPRLYASPPTDLGQEEVQRLFERVAAVLPREVQELPDPTHQVLLVFGQRQFSL